jgi:pimeloyl-ACP methyl ester carboxylesterase
VKPALLLLPGLLCDSALWDHQIKALAAKVEVTVPDITGHDSIKALAKTVLEKAPDSFALGALSMGGYVALEIMRQAPERVTRLLLMDTSTRPDTAEQTRRRRGLIELAKRGDFKGVTPRLLPMLIAPERLADNVLTKTIMDMAQRVGKEAFLRQQTAILGRVDSRPFLPDIKIPVTIICGEHDALTPPEHSHEMAQLIGGKTQVEVIRKSGHLAPLESPEAVNSILIKAMD